MYLVPDVKGLPGGWIWFVTRARTLRVLLLNAEYTYNIWHIRDAACTQGNKRGSAIYFPSVWLPVVQSPPVKFLWLARLKCDDNQLIQPPARQESRRPEQHK